VPPTSTIRPLPRRRRGKRRAPRNPNPDVRRRLLRAAGELIGEHGFTGLRVEEIAERAELSVGTFYLYFEGKDDLFAQLVVAVTEMLRRQIQAVYAGEGTVAQRLERALDTYLDYVERNERGFLYFRDAGTVHTTVGPLNIWTFEQHAEDLVPLLERAMHDGELRRQPAALLAQAMIGLVHHMAGSWLENKHRYTRADVKNMIRDLALAAARA
jgi:AcrR family transcriptional regulator